MREIDATTRHLAIFEAELSKSAEELETSEAMVAGENPLRQPVPKGDARSPLSQAVCDYIQHSRQGILEGVFAHKQEAQAAAGNTVNSLFSRGLRGMEANATLLEPGSKYPTMAERAKHLY